MNAPAPAPKTLARLPRGFSDRGPAELAATRAMVETIRKTYELWGFEAVETPFLEYTDALGKFLPDQDRPNAGVFSLQDDDEQWMSLRYDLTAPLARHVAENFDALPKPYRSYRFGPVFRNEKPGPGRFRQFLQFDADTVGSASVTADAEICMMAADTLEALGIARGDYVIKVNNRKLLDGVMEEIGLGGEENFSKRLIVLRAIDKRDRLGDEGVRALLGRGRRDESGDFTKGAELSDEEIEKVATFLASGIGDQDDLSIKIGGALRAARLGPGQLRALVKPIPHDSEEGISLTEEQIDLLLTCSDFLPGFPQPNARRRREKWPDDLSVRFVFEADEIVLPIDNMITLDRLRRVGPSNATFQEGVSELEQIAQVCESAKYGSGRILIDPSVVRGLEYYTGPVYEAELTFQVNDENGNPVRFGAVGGGGRYDGLVSRFRSEPVPATGISIGVSRLQAALKLLGHGASEPVGPVVVLVMDKDSDSVGRYLSLAARLRSEGIAAEIYLGTAGMKAQMRYADRRRSPVVVIQGSNERAKGEVTVKDLIVGAQASQKIADRAGWIEERPGQETVPEAEMVAKVKEYLSRHGLL